jgi:hypothetical protein
MHMHRIKPVQNPAVRQKYPEFHVIPVHKYILFEYSEV